MIEWKPSANVEIEKVATPLESGTVPSIVAPSLNVTLPVGVPSVDVTVAVNVTVLATAPGFAELVSTIVLPPLNAADAVCAEFIVTMQLPVPLHAPPQPLKTQPLSGV